MVEVLEELEAVLVVVELEVVLVVEVPGVVLVAGSARRPAELGQAR